MRMKHVVLVKSILIGLLCALLFSCLSYALDWTIHIMQDEAPGSPFTIAYGARFILVFCFAAGLCLDHYRKKETD